MGPYVEIIGYLASALVVVSLAMTSVVKLRVISLAGSVTFVVYGVMLGSVPVIITNASVALLNLWFLRKEFAKDRDLGAVPIGAQAPFLADFLRSHTSDIAKFQPGFGGVQEGDTAWLLTRDGLPAGALVGRKDGQTLHVSLDYVMAAYRDSRIGQWLYGPGAKVFKADGITRIVATPTAGEHRDYLLRVGFTAEGDRLVRPL